MTRFTVQQIPYAQTKAFSSIVTDYVAQAAALQPFYLHKPDLEGIKNSIAQRKQYVTNRSVLVEQLKLQYAGLEMGEKLQGNIDSLLLDNTFTITTAHQPNIFTGHLYFIYKILHAIKLAASLAQQIPNCHFVPVYYMGSEDADLAELGAVTINGQKYIWDTKQAGAVGRMKIDKAFIDLMDGIEGQISVEPFGNEMMLMLRSAYSVGKTMEQATLEIVHEMFAAYGLVILLPDNAVLKNEFAPIIRKELEEQFSNRAITETMKEFPAIYKVQTSGREVNLFYLKDNSRERIEKEDGHWSVVNRNLRFEGETILEELNNFPDRFSPNVILRPVFQEMLLPNIAFIGGGGELAYWLELKKVFEATGVPYPVLVLRNSFMVVSEKVAQKAKSLHINLIEFFKPTHVLMLQLVQQSSALKLELAEEKLQLENLYKKIGQAAGAVDQTLQNHTTALFVKANHKIVQLEKKMLVAEKKKYEAQQRQVEKIKERLFPLNTLQERVDNIIPYYAVYGKSFIEMLYQNSNTLEHEFCIVIETV
jgi:bacillithiol biosynthesis cysteine-adding enzyme BshC